MCSPAPFFCTTKNKLWFAASRLQLKFGSSWKRHLHNDARHNVLEWLLELGEAVVIKRSTIKIMRVAHLARQDSTTPFVH